MTIDLTDNAPRISYTVSTSTTSFAVPFEFFDDADLVVVVGGTTKTLTTHYTVSGGNGATGTVTMTSGNAVSSGTVIIFRDIDFKRSTDFPTSGAFPIATLNTELDRNIALFDDLQDRIDRSVRLNDNDDAASMVLPLKASRKGTVLGFNATTGAAEAGPTIANVNSLADITTNINTVAGIASNVTTVAGISSNVTTVAGISSAVSSVAGVASLITSDFVSDLNTLATSAIVEDLNILATTDIVSDLNQLATSDFVSDLSSVEGIKANVTSVGNNIANVNTVATQLTSDSPTFTNTVTASAYTTSGGGIFFIGNTSFRQTGLKNTSGELDIDASSNIKLTTNTGVINLFNDDTYFGRLNQDGNGELVISSGSSGGGGAPVTALTFSGANATFAGTINTTSTNKIQFGDSGTYIHQSADGVLDLVSDNEIEINGVNIDINSSGTISIQGATTFTDTTTINDNFILQLNGFDKITWDSSNERLTFEENVKLNFDGDLHIYHDNNHSYIEDVGVGNLILRASSGSDIILKGHNTETVTVDDAKVLLAGTTQLQFGDSGTYIRQSSDGVLNLVADGDMVITADGVVIGASSTATVFEATGSKNDQWAGKFTNTNSGGYGVLAVTAGSTSNEKAFEVRKNTSDTAMLIQGDGNVGIGTDSPAQKLDIQSSSTLSTRILATGNNTRAQLLTQAHTSGGSDVNMVLGSFGDSTRGEISMNTNHPLRLYTNNDPTKGVELETDGDLNIKDGNVIIETLGHGINFAGPTAQAGSISQILDAYEEGTFSASMVPSNSGTITLNSGVYKLAYTKIGRKVHIQGLLETTSKSSPVGTLRITNLPFTSVDDTQYAGRAGGALRATNVEGTGFGVAAPYSCYILEGGNILYADIDASTVHPATSPAYSQFYISISYNAT